MTDILSTSTGLNKSKRSAALSVAAIYTVTIFLSATLLFSVQPMFAKMVLPLLGGSTNVWNTAMVFFQSMLLGGYTYAHFVSKHLPFRAQIMTHGALIAAGFLFLPLALASGWTPPTSGAPTFWLLALFGVSVGVPFFALSANAPLLQRWFSYTSHKDADDPYFLYTSSNAGSLIILCAYPFLIEPVLRLGDQTVVWSLGYILLFGFILFAGFAAYGVRSMRNETQEEVVASVEEILSAKRIAFWVLLSFIPSSLMLGATTHITSNLASVPLLWILPLALYLLTFVVAFARKPLIRASQLGGIVPWVAYGVLILMHAVHLPAAVEIVVHLAAFFVIALYCHLRLVEDRPHVSKLTLFYILMSVGGVLGGIFNALVAPNIFSAVHEYILILAISAFVMPAGVALFDTSRKDWVVVAAVLAATPVIWVILEMAGLTRNFVWFCVLLVAFAALLKLNPPKRVKAGLLLYIFGVFYLNSFGGNVIVDQRRSFYSAMQVKLIETEYGPAHIFMHGNTVHGLQLLADDLRTEPTSYYTRGGPFDRIIQAGRPETGAFDLSIIGLGAGGMSCLAKTDDNITFFEIDQAVVDVARDTSLFTYLRDCAPNSDVIVGDARLRIEDLAPKSQDMIVLDAFSSNSIPAHLLTAEAMDAYMSHLKDTGVLVMHTSNRSLDVTSIVARLAQEAGYTSRFTSSLDKSVSPVSALAYEAYVIVVGNEASVDKVVGSGEDWFVYEPSRHVGVWTDDYHSLVGAAIARAKQDAVKVPVNR